MLPAQATPERKPIILHHQHVEVAQDDHVQETLKGNIEERVGSQAIERRVPAEHRPENLVPGEGDKAAEEQGKQHEGDEESQVAQSPGRPWNWGRLAEQLRLDLSRKLVGRDLGVQVGLGYVHKYGYFYGRAAASSGIISSWWPVKEYPWLAWPEGPPAFVAALTGLRITFSVGR